MKIHIIVAMQAEADHIIKALNLIKLNTQNDYDLYFNQIESVFVRLFVNKQRKNFDKVGTVHAALLAYKAIQFEKPDFILSVGTCGGIEKCGIQLFDLICAQNFLIYHDKFFGDEFEMHSQAHFPCVDLSSKLKNFCFGVVASSNSIIVDAKSWKIIDKYKVKCVDMEAAAVAEIAEEFLIPFSALKVVTDLVFVDGHLTMNENFKNNFHKAMELLASNLSAIIQRISK